jgi:iron complex transport system permease protein
MKAGDGSSTANSLVDFESGSPPLRTIGIWAGLVGAIVVLASLQLTVGVVFVPLSEVATLLSGGTSDDVWSRIVLDFRLPRALAALAAGTSLGVCGLLLQTAFRNPLADPWFLGLVHSARLGVAVLVVLSGAGGGSVLGGLGLVNNLGLAVAAGAGALAMTLVLVAIAPRVGAVTLLLTGLMLGQTAEGLISVILHFTTEAQGRAFGSWNDGTFTTVTLAQWAVLASCAAIGVGIAVVLVKPLNTLLLGDDYARTLGISVHRTRMTAVGAAALLAGAVTAFCGPVAFLGLLAPHLARALFGSADHRVLVPAAALVGAALALTADVITHLPWSRHFLHMNAVLGLIGGPVVVVLLLRGRSFHRYEG